MSDDSAETQASFDKILENIIDEWYDNVSSYYVTREQIEAAEADGAPLPSGKEELKRFHDEKGHRIKFAKDDLDFTYGLRCQFDDGAFAIEISVNNKVDGFDYEDFKARLTEHYEKSSRQKVTSPYELRSSSYQDIFEFRPSLEEAFTVEQRPEKADIMRLAFWVSGKYAHKLSARPVAGKQLVEQFCVSPFRSVYAAVYRRSR